MSSETIDVEPLLNFKRDLNFQQPKKGHPLLCTNRAITHLFFSHPLFVLLCREPTQNIPKS